MTGLAPGELGFYSRPAVSFIEGSYLTLRPSFGKPTRHLRLPHRDLLGRRQLEPGIFRESERLDAEFAQQGRVAVPNQSGFIYLVTNRQGQYRLVIISRPTIAGEMFGIMTTLQVGRGSQLTPVSAPIAYVPLRGRDASRPSAASPPATRATSATATISSVRSRSRSRCSCRCRSGGGNTLPCP